MGTMIFVNLFSSFLDYFVHFSSLTLFLYVYHIVTTGSESRCILVENEKNRAEKNGSIYRSFTE